MAPRVPEPAPVPEGVRKLFAGRCDFIAGAASEEYLPPAELPEIAFAGRSNVGKSSLINALVGQNALARVSHTPGRTQQLNFFNLADKLMMVDMPGYGYAAVGRKAVAGWEQLIHAYLRGRVVLRRVCLLIDGRHGLKQSDHDIMDVLDDAAVPYQIILTKADEPKPAELAATVAATMLGLKKHPAAMPEVRAVSSHRGDGMADLKIALAEIAGVSA